MKVLSKVFFVFFFVIIKLLAQAPDAVEIVKLDGTKYKKIYMSADKLIQKFGNDLNIEKYKGYYYKKTLPDIRNVSDSLGKDDLVDSVKVLDSLTAKVFIRKESYIRKFGEETLDPSDGEYQGFYIYRLSSPAPYLPIYPDYPENKPEVRGKRTPYSRTFRNEDGTYTTILTVRPTSYPVKRTGGTEWEEIPPDEPLNNFIKNNLKELTRIRGDYNEDISYYGDVVEINNDGKDAEYFAIQKSSGPMSCVVGSGNDPGLGVNDLFHRAMYQFNTTSIPDNSTINSVDFQAYVSSGDPNSYDRTSGTHDEVYTLTLIFASLRTMNHLLSDDLSVIWTADAGNSFFNDAWDGSEIAGGTWNRGDGSSTEGFNSQGISDFEDNYEAGWYVFSVVDENENNMSPSNWGGVTLYPDYCELHVDYTPPNHDPELSDGDVSPSSGNTSTNFTYEVDYYDEDGDSPSNRRVYIDGSYHNMSLSSGSASDGTYTYETTLSAGSHNYYFSFTDGEGGSDRLPSSGSYSGPSVSEINHDPELSSGDVSPNSGNTSTNFTYEVDYYDEDGDSPSNRRVYIDGSYHNMSLSSGSASNGTYTYETTLSAGSHNYYFSFTDGEGGSDRLPSSGSYSGPSVPINHDPELSSGDVSPNSGNTSTIFTYEVDYYDEDGDSPSNRRVYIDGSYHNMSLSSGSASDGTYTYETTLSAGSHNYYFSFTDGEGGSDRLPSSGTYSGPSVSAPEEPYLHLSANSWEPSPAGETSNNIGVTNTGGGEEFDYNISTEDDWLTPSTSSGTTSGNFTITADANTTGSSRTGYVVVEATEGGVENSPDTVTVTQSGETPYLSISPDSWNFSSEGGTSDNIEVTNAGAGGEFDYNISTDSLWLDLSASSGSTPGSFTITADNNTSGSERTGYVVVEATDGEVENSPDTVTVTQSGDSPHISVSPDSLSDSLLTGETSVRTLTVYNTGSGDLTINISTWERLLTLLKSNKTTTGKVSISSQFEYLEVGKNEVDPRQGNPVVLGAGGPDAFGYTWIDSDEGGSCNFEWEDITSTGTQVTGLSDDDYAGPYPISFEFPFYDSVYTEFYVSSNGFIGFGPTSDYSDLSNQTIPTSDAPDNIVAWCWDDLYPRGSVYYEDFGDKLVVQFVDYGEYGEDGRINAEVIIHQSGKITIQYLNSYDGFDLSGSTIGIENITGADGLEVAFNTDYIHDGLAVDFFRGATWLSVDPVSDTISSGSSVDIEVTFDATGLYGGDYYSDIIISSNDPDTSEFPVPAHLHVISVSDIVVSEDTLDYGIVFAGGSYYDTLIVEYTGTDSLTVSDISSDNQDFIADTTNFTLNPGEEQEVEISFIPSALGAITGNLTISSDDPNSPSTVVFLQGECVEPPDISVSPDSLIGTLPPGENSTDTLTIYNTGINDLVFDILISPEWLFVDPISDTVSSGDSTLSEVTFDATGLNDGNYFDYITISNNDPDESELIIPVYLNVLSGGVEEKEIPEVFFIKQNYPNPFSCQTVISYGCPEKAKVCIQVFDCSGRIVQTLIDKEVEAGYHEVKWGGTNEFGKNLSNAIYFYRIQAGNFIKTKKMIFIQ